MRAHLNTIRTMCINEAIVETRKVSHYARILLQCLRLIYLSGSQLGGCGMSWHGLSCEGKCGVGLA